MKTPTATDPVADFRVERGEDGTLTLAFTGRLSAQSTGALWRRAIEAVENEKPRQLTLETSGLAYCDGAGVGLLIDLQRHQRRRGGKCAIEGLAAEFRTLLDLFGEDTLEQPAAAPPKPSSFPDDVGKAVVQLLEDLRGQVAFIGELTASLGVAIRFPRHVRWRDAFLTAEKAGVNACPIVALIGFLMGLIMAFQSAIPMKQFGVELFVANLVALSLFRELGPLMTAIILAGRSGSAFAAEIGTMKVNEEINALVTMGLEPVRFLVVTRVLATVIMAPLLTIVANFLGLVGGAIVILSFGYPLVTYVNQVISAVNSIDLMGGLFKAVVFGVLVAGVGCMRGLQTRTGASAVGDSTTRSVVSGIVLIVIADGIFSVLFYYLDI